MFLFFQNCVFSLKHFFEKIKIIEKSAFGQSTKWELPVRPRGIDFVIAVTARLNLLAIRLKCLSGLFRYGKGGRVRVAWEGASGEGVARRARPRPSKICRTPDYNDNEEASRRRGVVVRPREASRRRGVVAQLYGLDSHCRSSMLRDPHDRMKCGRPPGGGAE